MGTEDFFESIKIFWRIFLNFDIVESNLKAYHVLPTKRILPGNLMPSAVLKFVHFLVQDKFCKLRRLLKADFKYNRYPASPMNGNLIYINERLPPIDLITKFAADDMNYVTTYKSAVSVLCADPSYPNGINKHLVPVNSIEDLKQIQYSVLKRKRKLNYSGKK